MRAKCKFKKIIYAGVSLTSWWRRIAWTMACGLVVGKGREAARRWKLNRTATGQVSEN